MLRQSSSHCLLLGKMDGDVAKKAKSKEVGQLKSMVADSSETREPSRVEEGMKPVTISSEEGMRTILASPLLQAELAKNKPLQKLFMQAVQQQKQSREKQELRAAAAAAAATMEAEARSKEAEARSQRLSTEQASNSQRDQQQQQQRSLSKPDPAQGNRPQQTAADQSGGKPKSQIAAPQGRTKGASKPPPNQPQSSAALGLKPQVISPQSNTAPGGKVPQQPAVQSSTAKVGKTPQEPCRVSEVKKPQMLSQCSSAQASQAAANGKARNKPQQQQQQQQASGNKDQLSPSAAAPKSKLQSLQNPPNKKQTNGLVGSHDDTIKQSTVDASLSNAASQNGRSSLSSNGSSANIDARSKSENKKTAAAAATAVGCRKNKKSFGPPGKIVDDEVQSVSEAAKILNGDVKKSHLADVNNRTRAVVNGAPELEIYTTNDRRPRVNSSTIKTESTDAAASENNQASNGAVGGAGATTKSKKSKRKNKSKSSLSVVDEIFMPKDVPGDFQLDENEREIEEFKRFCSNSAPSENRRKVNLNNVRELFNKNVKDLFNKKKNAAAAAGCQ